jgi:putative transposase
MPRIARVVLPGIPHHLTQRGNGHRDVFRGDEDRRLYLDLYRKYSARYQVRTWGYCLVSNHVHLVAVPEREDSLAKALGRTHADYARYFNVRHGGSGHLWESRFFSCPLEGDHVWAALRYVERNPVQGGMVREAGHGRWSSTRAHILGADPDGFLAMDAWRDVFWTRRLAQRPRRSAERGLRAPIAPRHDVRSPAQ